MMSDAVADTPTKRQPYRASSERRIEIARAALTCLERDGYAALTARAVAAEAGLALGHITYHFRNMDELMAEAYRLASADLRAETARQISQSDGTPAERLMAFLTGGFRPPILTRPYVRFRIDVWSASMAYPAIAETELALYDSYRAELRNHLVAFVDRPDLPEAAIVATTDAMLALLDGLWLDWMRRNDQTAVDNGLAACLVLAKALRTTGQDG